MATTEAQQQLNDLIFHLNNVPENMRTFSLSMRSLFAEYAVGTSSDTARRFRVLRDGIRKNAVEYIEKALPIVRQCVSDIKSYFEYYQDLTMEEWLKGIDSITKEAKAHKDACNTLIVIHEAITAKLNQQQGEAKCLIDELKDLSAKHERNAKQQQEITVAQALFNVVLFIIHPFLLLFSAIANLFARANPHIDLVETIATQKEAEIQAGAAAVVRDSSIPALALFVDGIKAIASFFNVVHQEMISLQNKKDRDKEVEDQIRIHYNTMRGKAGQIMGGCNRFFAILPSIRSDLEAIPTEGTDQNYVDRWMENQKSVSSDKNDPLKSNKID